MQTYKITPIIPTPTEEYKYLIDKLRAIPLYINGRYSAVIELGNDFLKLATTAPDLDPNEIKRLEKVFIESVYDSTFYEKGLNKLTSPIDETYTSLSKLETLLGGGYKTTAKLHC